ncbi:DNA (cytosine-5-)-methyltransferase [Lysobacter sp. A03]|uniref:DNA cytosine methyltransferase n=1 Tax=Lysobacter sp. A03 TaxID=1199154 RepID=UPI0005B6F25D|nr:DNA (cytosine-5-)-methyltransferase [Lysobacter sp. A03]KIQ97346.1 Modification methylase [Lysobacter sp. A03]
MIDIFAGPGGLGEGFSSFETSPGSGRHPFELAVSAEMEPAAHSTLRLRAFYRLLTRLEGQVPPEYLAYLELVARGDGEPPSVHFSKGKWRALWDEAEREALNLTLGEEQHNRILNDRIAAERSKYDELILIGGPPCQAYSLVGRARQKNVKGFRTKGDTRHFLYRQYLGILAEFSPALFIMENVKGILTSKVGSREMFGAIMRDLEHPSATLASSAPHGASSERYVLLPIHVGEGKERTSDLVLHDPNGFIIRSESHGVPQARHRVIIMGVREDLMHPGIATMPGLPVADQMASIATALAGLPKLRSGLSRQADDAEKWRKAMESERDRVAKVVRTSHPEVSGRLERMIPAYTLPRRSIRYADGTSALPEGVKSPAQTVVLNHETRGHMQSDLGRYMFCAAFAEQFNRSPMSSEFPKRLAPDHLNWDTGAFSDRFRVQVYDRPSNTVTSHLSKDGHAFIHWDPAQCRSLTVREAARLQTFPDDYLFLGNRTQQYVQVGNAVPPVIARQIAGVVWNILSSDPVGGGPHGESRT